MYALLIYEQRSQLLLLDRFMLSKFIRWRFSQFAAEFPFFVEYQLFPR
jgi:hypothetical protein